LVSFLHRQPEGSQLASTRYYRIVFHCNILPGSLYLRFSKLKPFRTVVSNRQDPSSKFSFLFFFYLNILNKNLFLAIFGFRSVGAFSRVQIQNHMSGRWLCMNHKGKIVQQVYLKFNIQYNFLNKILL
jgi:hypothetical protein